MAHKDKAHSCINLHTLLPMEACFLSSNSFTKKTTEFVPSIKTRSFAHPKRKPKLVPCRKVGVPSFITRCHSGSEDNASDNTDWRSFRARLVAGEQASRPADSVLNEAHPLSISLADKWAHTIHNPEKGCLLIATEKLDGVHIFERTVILLLSMGPWGPTGLILNRPSLMSIKEMQSSPLAKVGAFADRPLFFGGPMEGGLFLVRGNKGVVCSGVFEEVMKGLYYGSIEGVGSLAEMVKRNMVSLGDLRFFRGYCGWAKEQLTDEIKEGLWTVAACSPNVVGLDSVGSVGLWDDILGLMGQKKAL